MRSAADGRDSWSARLAAAAIRLRYSIVGAALALTVGASFLAADLLRLHVRTNPTSLLPKDHPSVQNLLRIVDKTGGLGDLMVVIHSPDPAANRRFAGELQASLADLPWVNYAEYRVDTEFFRKHALLLISRTDLQTIEERLRSRYEYEVARHDPFYVDLLEEGPPSIDFSDIEARYLRGDTFRPYHASADGTTLVLAVYPLGVSGEIRDSQRFLADLTAKLAAVDPARFGKDLTVRVGGTFKDRIEEYDSIMRDLKRSIVIMSLLFVTLLFFFLRQMVAVAIVSLTVAMPLSWTFAFTRVVVLELNSVTVFLVVILSGLGVDFALHVVTRYLEERARGNTLAGALTVVNLYTARASWSSALTTAVAFWVLTASRFLGFRQFGLIAGCGVMFAYLSALLVLPSLLAIADEFRLLRSREVRLLPPILRPTSSRPCLLASAVLALVGVVAMPRIEFEYDFGKLRTELSAQTQELGKTIRLVFGGARDPVVFLARDLRETDEIVRILGERMKAGGRSLIEDVRSVRDLVPADQPERLRIIAGIGELVAKMDSFAAPADRERIAKYRDMLSERGVSVSDIPGNMKRRFLGLPGTEGNLVYVLHRVALGDTRRGAELVSQIGTIQGKGTVWRGASEAIVVNDLVRIMKEDSTWVIPLSGLTVFLVLLADFRSARRAVITLLPLVVGLLWMLAFMWMGGLKLNLYNMVVLPSIIGIGVDSGVHVYHRCLESPNEPVTNVLRCTRGAVAMCSLTTMISFGSMMFGVHRGLASLGLLAVLGLGCTLVASTVVFPAFLERYRTLCGLTSPAAAEASSGSPA